MVAQARYWILTIPVIHLSTPTLSGDLVYIRGQQEISASGLHHWQLLAVFNKKLRLRSVKEHFCNEAHCEPTRSEAANDYVWKEDTRVAGTQFELGRLPFSRARKTDWDSALACAKAGDLDNIPADVLLRYYGNIKRIHVDNLQPERRDNIHVRVYWGLSGTGKTRRATLEAGDGHFPKGSGDQWWDGYQGQTNVIIDEFAGGIPITDLLRWLDRYPCTVPVKGSTVALKAVNFWLTSNFHPRDWYKDIGVEQRNGLLRRIHELVEFSEPWIPPQAEPEPEPVLSDTPSFDFLAELLD